MNKSKQHTLSNTVRLLLMAMLAITLTLGSGQTAQAFASPAPVDIGTAADFVVLAKTGISATGTTAIIGDLGVSPISSTAITGFGLIMDPSNTFSTSSLVNGKIYAANYAAPTPAKMTTAISNMEAAYTDAAGRAPNVTELGSGDISGLTLAPGVYKWSTGVSVLTGDVTLAGSPTDVWIFEVAGNLLVASDKHVFLSGGAQARNVFWQVGGGVGVNIQTTAHIVGNILAVKGINFFTGATIEGRALSQTAVTLDGNAVVIPGAGVAGITVTPTNGLITTEAGGAATFTVVLDTQPTSDVMVGLTSSDTTEGTVLPASLTFTTTNWNNAQTVTVTGVDDALADGNVAYTIVTAAATSSDANYNGLNPLNVGVRNTDNDIAGITVSPTSGLITTEAGGTATFTVVLNGLPTANVTVGLTSSDTTEGTVLPASLTFTTANWNVAQTVTVTGVNDALADGNVAYAIITAPTTSSDASYNGINPLNVDVTNTDDDAAGITVTPTNGLITTEAGGAATFTVVLTSLPTADVTVGLTSSDTTEGTVLPASLTFTTANWNVAQTVTVTGVDDALADGNVAYTIVTAPAVSSGVYYNGMDPLDVSVTNTDDDVAGITVSPISGLITTEAGGTATFTVVLNRQPTANVIVGLTSSDTTEGAVSHASLTFTAANWKNAQTITVTGVDDALADGSVAYTIVTAAATSSDTNYNGLNPSDVGVTNTDDETAGITITIILTGGLTTTEAGGADAFTVVLDKQPTADVTVGLTSDDTTEGTVSSSSLIFTATNWNVAQTVTVTGVDDSVVDGDVAYMIVTAAAASADVLYNGINPLDVGVLNIDNDNVVTGLNYVCNGSFEKYPNAVSKVPTCWNPAKFGPGDGKNTKFKKQGIASLSFIGSRGKSSAAVQIIPLSGNEGDQLTFSFWVKGADISVGGKCAGHVYLYNGHDLHQTKTILCPTGSYGFKKQEIHFTANSTYTMAVIKFSYTKFIGQVWFDAVSLIR
jgi:hypothetical protein